MEVKILGTVSPYCSKNNNCPGFLITSGDTKILLDCGNGITNEMILTKDLENLTIIISHLHRDHYGDLLSLGSASFVYHNLGYLSSRIKVLLPPPNVYKTSESYLDADGWGSSRIVEKEIIDYTFLNNLGELQYFDIETYNPNRKIKIGNLEVSFSLNPHDINSYSIKVEDDKTSLVYSGDTGYKGNTLERFAKGTNLLICESTFLRGQTRNKDYHLYAHEAAEIARICEPNKLILTHFWPDIDKRKYLSEALPIYPHTEVAEEGKILKLI